MDWLRLDIILEQLTIGRLLLGGWLMLVIAMAVAMRTQWGQEHPLRTCAVLSLVAHVLLALMAATIPFVRPLLPDQEPGTLVMSHVQLETGDAPEPTSTPKAPRWDQFAANNLPETAPKPNVADAEIPAEQPAELAPEYTPPAEDSQAQVAELMLSQWPEAPSPTTSLPAQAAPSVDAVANADPVPMAEPTPSPDVARPTIDPNMVSAAPAETQPEGMIAAEMSRAATERPVDVVPPEPTIDVARANPTPLPESEALVPIESLMQPPTPEMVQAIPLADEPINPLDRRTTAQPVSTALPSSTPEIAAADLSPVWNPQRDRRDLPAAAPAAAPEIYRHRWEENRAAAAARRGGDADTEAAVQSALRWLAAAQSSDGRWDAERWGAGRETRVDGQDRGGAGRKADTAVTGLALLAFLGAGQLPDQGAHGVTVRRGLEYLIRVQDPTGHLGGNAETYAFMYSHAMASYALCEAYALTRADWLAEPARRAVSYTLRCQDPNGGGWRYYAHEAGDTSVLGWQLMTLNSARFAGIEWPVGTRERIERFLSSVRGGRSSGLTSYRPNQAPSRSMTAEGWYCRQMLGLELSPEAKDEAAAALMGDMPGRGPQDLYYWYYATLALERHGGATWERWNESLKAELLRTQRTDAQFGGTWDPNGRWGGHGGRVYSTAMATLCLEVYYRFAK